MQNLKKYLDTPMDSTSVMGRRRLVFRYLAQGLSGARMHPIIEKSYPCSLSTIHRDLRCMSEWLPELLNLNEGDEKKAFERLIGNYMLSQERLLQLSYIGDNSSSQVGASKGLATVTQLESELRMDAGQLRREPFQLESVHHVEPDLEGLDEKAIHAIVQNFMDAEARRFLGAPVMVEPPLGGATAAEPGEKVGTDSSTLHRSVGVSAPRPHLRDPGCSECRLFGRSCGGPDSNDLDETGRCIHIQPWNNGNRERGLSI